jgi:putative ABC transport system ATP-binding protein
MTTTDSGKPMPNNIIELRHIIKRYFIGKPNELQVLTNLSLDVADGEFLSIVGESGSGKSTLMNIIGLLDKPTEGTYRLAGVDTADQPDKVKSRMRGKQVGFVFQTFNLIGRMTAQHNVEVPLFYSGIPARARTRRSEYLLELVGMSDRARHMPNELSGGQKQRVAIARAMANDPDVILADEPTGALDSHTGRLVMDIFHDLNRNYGKTVVLITHNQELAEETDRIITLKDGVIVAERTGSGPAASGGGTDGQHQFADKDGTDGQATFAEKGEAR